MTIKTENMLAHYEAEPMQPGDVALLLDDGVCMEVEGLADNWSANIRRNLATMLRPISGQATSTAPMSSTNTLTGPRAS